MQFENIRKLADKHFAKRSPASALGEFLLTHTNNAEYAVSALRAYLTAAEADLQAEKELVASLHTEDEG